MPDYYAILGVPRDASAEDIKRAYRKLARESHPDANPDDPHAEERFKQIAEAYGVLGDPERKRQFDTFGEAGSPFSGAGFGGLDDIMEAFFGGSVFGRQRTARRRSAAIPGQDIGAEVVITLEDAVFGAKRDLDLRSRAHCDRCGGEGCEPGTYRGKCARCGGQGEIRASRNTLLGTVMTSRPCTVCEGVGEAPTVPCTTCGGDGRVDDRRTVTVDVPAGVDDGTTMRIRGRGESGVRGGADGDLYVRIHVEPHDVFERRGNDLLCALEVPLTQAVLGAEIPVQTLDGAESVDLPAGAPHGTVLRVRGKGVPHLNGGGRGDLLLHVSIDIPKKLTAEERTLIEQLAALRGESVKSGKGKGVFRRVRDSILGE